MHPRNSHLLQQYRYHLTFSECINIRSNQPLYDDFKTGPSESFVGPFSVTRPNPTHQLSDLTQPIRNLKIWIQPNPTRYNYRLTAKLSAVYVNHIWKHKHNFHNHKVKTKLIPIARNCLTGVQIQNVRWLTMSKTRLRRTAQIISTLTFLLLLSNSTGICMLCNHQKNIVLLSLFDPTQRNPSKTTKSRPKPTQPNPRVDLTHGQLCGHWWVHGFHWRHQAMRHSGACAYAPICRQFLFTYLRSSSGQW